MTLEALQIGNQEEGPDHKREDQQNEGEHSETSPTVDVSLVRS